MIRELRINDDYIWVAITDECAGVKHRYTVCRLHRRGSKKAKVIGRELPLNLAKKVAKNDLANG